MKPLVSIVTPSLNQGEFIESCIKSLASQTYPRIEHIIVDGGSTDETLAVIHEHQHSVAIFRSERDQGTSEAINKGFSWSSGDFLWVLNSDDYLIRTDAIEILVETLLVNAHADFVCGDLRLVDCKGRTIGVRKFPAINLEHLLLDRRHLPFAGCLMRRTCYDRLGGFDTDLKYANDIEFFCRLTTEKPLYPVRKVLADMRIHSSSSTQSNIALVGRETISVCRRYSAIADANGLLSMPRTQVEAALDAQEAGYHFHGANRYASRDCVKKAVKKEPIRALQPTLVVYFLSSYLSASLHHAIGVVMRAIIKTKIGYKINSTFYRLFNRIPRQ